MRFTIRDLLWLTVVVALAVGWWAECRNHGETAIWRRFAEWQRDRLALLIEMYGHKVTLYDGWRVDVDDNSIGYDETLREVPWRRADSRRPAELPSN